MDVSHLLVGRIKLGQAPTGQAFQPMSSKGMPGMISEDRVRQIVREELAEALKRLMPPVV